METHGPSITVSELAGSPSQTLAGTGAVARWTAVSAERLHLAAEAMR